MTASNPQILLVDDNPQNLRLLRKLLEHNGYSTRLVTSGVAALEAVHQLQPDLVLLDVMMPDMGGFEVCRTLRADPQFQAIPIIFLTALDDDASRLQGLEIMGDDYLTKPIQFELVLAKVANLLKLNQLRQSNQLQPKGQTRQLRSISKKQIQRGMSRTIAEKFRLFVPEQFLRRLAPEGVESIQLGHAIEADVTILFCDIRDFTAIAEAQPMQATFSWLNAFFDLVNQIVTQHGGFIDKYLGDAVIAVFDQPCHHVINGLEATLEIQKALKQFNRCAAVNPNPLTRIGIGLHVGKGLIGTVGSQQRMDATVIGDVVNTASRLEELTKDYGCQTLVSGEVIERLPADHPFQIRWIDSLSMRGKQQVSQIYEVIGAS